MFLYNCHLLEIPELEISQSLEEKKVKLSFLINLANLIECLNSNEDYSSFFIELPIFAIYELSSNKIETKANSFNFLQNFSEFQNNFEIKNDHFNKSSSFIKNNLKINYENLKIKSGKNLYHLSLSDNKNNSKKTNLSFFSKQILENENFKVGFMGLIKNYQIHPMKYSNNSFLEFKNQKYNIVYKNMAIKNLQNHKLKNDLLKIDLNLDVITVIARKILLISLIKNITYFCNFDKFSDSVVTYLFENVVNNITLEDFKNINNQNYIKFQTISNNIKKTCFLSEEIFQLLYKFVFSKPLEKNMTSDFFIINGQLTSIKILNIIQPTDNQFSQKIKKRDYLIFKIINLISQYIPIILQNFKIIPINGSKKISEKILLNAINLELIHFCDLFYKNYFL